MTHVLVRQRDLPAPTNSISVVEPTRSRAVIAGRLRQVGKGPSSGLITIVNERYIKERAVKGRAGTLHGRLHVLRKLSHGMLLPPELLVRQAAP